LPVACGASTDVTSLVSVCVGSVWKILLVIAVACGASPDVTSLDVTDSREKRNQGQSDFLRQKIW
jgi:hypothetical protein